MTFIAGHYAQLSDTWIDLWSEEASGAQVEQESIKDGFVKYTWSMVVELVLVILVGSVTSCVR